MSEQTDFALEFPSFTKGLALHAPRNLIENDSCFLAENMSLLKGSMGLAPGSTKIAAQVLSGSYILDMDTYTREIGISQLLVKTTTRIYVYDGVGTFTDISVSGGYAGLIDDEWQSDEVVNPSGDLYYITTNNKVDPVQLWDGTAATFVNLAGGLTDSGKHYSRSVAEFQNRLMHLNRTETGVNLPRKLVWSDNGLPETYSGGESGSLTLFQGPDSGVRLEAIGNYMTAYRSGSIHLISYIGQPFFMAQRQVVSGIGLVAAKALVNLDIKHVFLGPDNVYVFNGVQVIAVADSIRDTLFDKIDPVYISRSRMFLNEDRAEIYLVVAQTDSVTAGIPDFWYVWEIETNTWSGPWKGRPATGVGDFFKVGSSVSWNGMVGKTWANFHRAWVLPTSQSDKPLTLYGGSNGLVYEVDDAVATVDGVAQTGRVETKSRCPAREFRVPVYEMVCTHLLPLGSNLTSTRWYVGTSDSPLGPFTFSVSAQQDVTGYVKLPPTRGKWFVFAAETTAIANIDGCVAYFSKDSLPGGRR